jgi:tetratricopeptide (TPR) repeat protein
MQYFLRTFLLAALFLINTAPASSQTIPARFVKTTDSVIKATPVTYVDLDAALRPYRRDTLLMNYFILEAAKQNYQDGMAYAYNQLGIKFRNISNFERAIAFHEKGLDAAVAAGNTEFRIFSLNMLGVVYRRNDAIKTALDYNQEALELAESIENPSEGIKRSINVSLNSIGNIYQALRQYDLAIIHYRRSLNLEGALGNKRGLAVNYQNLGECLEAQGKLDEALASYRTSLDYDRQLGSERGITICNNSISQIYIKQGKPREAYDLLKETLVAAEATGDRHITSLVHINTGWALMDLARYEEAKSALLIGLRESEDHNLLQNIALSYNLLSKLSQTQGRFEEALEYYKKAEEFDKKVNNDLNLTYVNDVIMRYDAEKKNNQIEILAKENEIVKLRLKRNQNTLLLSALMVALFSVILYILYRQYQLKSEKKLLTLEQSMLRSQMNPHFLFNSLNSIKLYIINNEKKNAVHYLNKFSKLVRKILEASSVREIALAEELETVELYMNIENIRFNDEIQFEISVDEGIDTHLVKIPSLILQPFLENALWHGLSSKEGEKRIHLHVSRERSSYINITITDNGVGREESEKMKERRVLKRKSVGIDITRERLANFSKDFQNSFQVDIVDLYDENNKPSGTQIVLHIPTV